MSRPMDAQTTRAADALVTAWLRDGSANFVCPECDGGPVTITDDSARPHAKWYLIDCAACGHHVRLHRSISRSRGADEL